MALLRIVAATPPTHGSTSQGAEQAPVILTLSLPLLPRLALQILSLVVSLILALILLTWVSWRSRLQ